MFQTLTEVPAAGIPAGRTLCTWGLSASLCVAVVTGVRDPELVRRRAAPPEGSGGSWGTSDPGWAGVATAWGECGNW